MRPARPEDAAAVAAVHVRSWQAAYEHVFGRERLAAITPESRQRIAERGIASGGVSVAEGDEGHVIGFVSVGPSPDVDGEGELYAIYVVDEAWGSGAGTALMAAAKALLAHYESAVLWVLEDNPRARRFYEREGWRADGGRKTEPFLGVDVPEVRYRL